MKKKHVILKALLSAVLLGAGGMSVHAADGIIETREYTICPGDTIKMDTRKTVVFRDTILYDTIIVSNPMQDSVYKYIVNTYPSFEKEEFRSIESGQSFEWRGLTITKAGDYQRVYKTVEHGCDSTYILHVTEAMPKPEKEVMFTLCDGESVTFNGETYTNAGTYFSDYTPDSVYKITIVKYPSSVYLTTATFDGVHPYLWRLNGKKDSVVTEGGVHEYKARNDETGCSDIYRLILTLDTTVYHFIEKETICENEEFNWHHLTNLNRQGIGETTHYFDRYRTYDNQKDSVYELILTVNPVPRATRTIPFCESIVWNGKTYTESTRIVDTLRSIQYSCDSIVTTFLSKGLSFYHHDTATITMGETLEWHGQTINIAGQYEDKNLSSFGCDSIYTIGVGMLDAPPQAKIRKYFETICEGSDIEWRGKTYWQKGMYYDTTFVAGKMDSLYVLVLSVNEVYNSTEHVTFPAFPVTYRSTDIPGPGIYPIKYTSTLGCDSIITVMVDREVIRDIQTVTICPGEVYSWRGHIYQEPYQYKEVEKDINGNDSVEHILNLTVRYIPETRITKTICSGNSITFGDETLSTSGVYRHTFHQDGCDSVVVLSLNVINPDTVKYVHNMKEGEVFEWHDSIYTETGMDFYSTTNLAGCDSIEMLILTVNHVDTIDTTAVICPNETMEWHGIVARQSGDFTGTELHEDGSVGYYRLHLTVRELMEKKEFFTICADESVKYNGKTYDKPGYYYDYLGCDTIVEIHITRNPQQVYETNAKLGGTHGFTWTFWDNGEEKTEVFTEAGTYEYENPNPETGCSDIWRLVLSIDKTSYHFVETLTICEGDDFSWHGLHNLSQQPGTSRYYDNYKTRTGQDSIYELVLTVNPAVRSVRTISFCGSTVWKGRTYTQSVVVYDTLVSKQFGCDSIVRVNLDKASSFFQHDTATIVQGEVLKWHGIDINTDGLYRDIHQNIYGCDSIYEIGVGLVAATPQTNLYTTLWSICEGDVYTWRGKDYMTGGTYVDTVWDKGREKVDSIFALNLTVWSSNLDTVIQHLYQCQKGAYIRYNGKDYYENDTIVTKFRTIHNCDSIVKTILHFNEALFLSDTIKISDKELPYTWKFKLYDKDRKDSVLTTAGTYKHDVGAEGGCDNHEEIVLLVYQTYLFVKDTAICQTEAPYKWTDGPKDKLDVEYSHTPGETKTYEWSYKTVNGYDSIYRLNLTIYPTYERRQQLNLCEDEVQTYNGRTYYGAKLKSDTLYRDTIRLSSLNNCDSIIYMEIMKHPVKRHTETRILHQGDTIRWNEKEITAGGTYSVALKQAANGCDSIEELRVILESPDVATICVLDTPYIWTVNKQNYYTTGFYTDTIRDDDGEIEAFHTLDLKVMIPVDTTVFLRGCEHDGVAFNSKVYFGDTVFIDTLACDTIYRVSIKIDSLKTFNITDTICEQDLPYILGAQNPDTIWCEERLSPNTYIHTDYSPAGCEMTKYNLTLYIRPYLEKNDSIFVCEDEIATNPVILGDTTDHPWFDTKDGGIWHGKWEGKWKGIEYTEDTIVYNCDSTHYMHIIVRPRQPIIPDTTYWLCEGDSVQLFWPHDTTWISKPGVYYDTVPTHSAWRDTHDASIIHYDRAYECDSVTQWTVRFAAPLKADTTEKHIPEGDSIWWGGQYQYFKGYHDSICDNTEGHLNAENKYCQEHHWLHLIVDTIKYYVDTINICYEATKQYTYKWEDDYVMKFNTPDKDTTVFHVKDSLKQNGIDFYDTYYDLVVYYKQLYRTQIKDTICYGDSLLFDRHRFDMENNVTIERYVKDAGIYVDTLTALNGCDSIIELRLYVRDRMLPAHKRVTVTDRELPYLWEHHWTDANGIPADSTDTLRATGEYRFVMPNRFGCDSIDSLSFTVHQTHVFRDTIDVCAPINTTKTYEWFTGYKQKFRTPKKDSVLAYADTLQTRIKFDSIYVLQVNFHRTYETHVYDTICAGDSVQIDTYIESSLPKRYYHKTGIYHDTIPTVNGCDSIITLHLQVWPGFPTTIRRVDIADIDTPYLWKHSWLENGVMVRDTDSLSIAGGYSRILPSIHGCDSIDSLTLYIHQTYHIWDDTINICAKETPYTWRGQTNITKTGDYRYGELTTEGYDSVHYVHINVLPQIYDTIRAAICEGGTFLFKGVQLTKAGTYNDTLQAANGCDSIQTLVLTVNTPYHHVIRENILEGEFYVFYGDTLRESITLTHGGRTPEGCDSTTILQLVVHQPVDTIVTVCSNDLPYIWHNRWSGNEEKYYRTGLYRNDTTINNERHFYGLQIVVKEQMFDTIRHSMCEGASYEFKGNTYTESGIYRDTLTAKNGCDSILTLILTVNKPYYSVIREDVLEGQSVEFYGNTYTTSGTYPHYSSTKEGCDSTTILQLTVHQLIDTVITVCSSELPYIWFNKWSGAEERYYASGVYRNDSVFDSRKHFYGMQLIVNEPVFKTINHSMCEGAEYLFGGKTYTTGVTVKDTLRAENGCDSIVTLILTVNKPYHHVEKIDILEGQSIEFFGNTYNTTGTYTHYNTTPEGCDSTSILQLTVHQLIDTVITVCSPELPYIWYNKWSGEEERYYTSGTYRNDSTFDNRKHYYGMQLIVNEPVFKTIKHSMCEGSVYTFKGNRYTEAGTYKDTLHAQNGCDSIVTLILTVNKPYHHVEVVDLLEGQSVEFFGNTYNTTGTYTHYNNTPEGCDSTSILQLTVHQLIDTIITVCSPELPYIWYNKWSGEEERYYTSGTYRNDSTFDNRKHYYGMQLIVNEPVFKTIKHSMCEGSVYTFKGNRYTEAGTYKDTLHAQNGCDSIVTLILTVNKPYHHVEVVDLLEGQSVEFFGNTYNTTGTYTHYNNTPEGCDSTSILQLTVHQLIDTIITVCSPELPYIWYNKWSGEEERYYTSGTYRNDSTFDNRKHYYGMQLIVNEPVFKTIKHSMCEGSVYTFKGNRYTEAGTYKDTLHAQNGCDSIVTLILTVNKPYHHVEVVDLLEGQSIEFFGNTYNTTGTYTHYNTTPEGCDSTSILQLTVHQLIDTIITVCSPELPYIWYNKWSGEEERYYTSGTYRNDSTFDNRKHYYGMQLIVNEPVFKTIKHSMCEGSVYTFKGNRYTEAGTYKDTLHAQNGCDSIVTLILTVNKPYHHVEVVDLLEGQSVEFFGNTYNTTGTYTHYNNTPEGCDSTSILQLTVHQLIDTIITTCSSDLPYIWHNKWSGEEERYYTSGTYRNDSTFDNRKHYYGMQLIVNEPVFKTIKHSMCEGSVYTFKGNRYTEAGTYKDTLHAQNGCDSIVTLILTVNKPYHHVEVVDLLEGQSVEFFGNTYNTTGTYTHYNNTPEGCDSTSILQLTVHQLIDTVITVCSPELPYIWHNKWSGEEERYYTSGTYRNDSTFDNRKHYYGMQLIVNEPVFKTIKHNMCEGSVYTFKGNRYTEAGTYKDTLHAQNGCDSIVTLILTVNKPYHHVEVVDLLEGQSVEFFGNTYNTTGTYTHYNNTPEGCDSTSILQLTVHQLVDTTVTVCSTDLPYIWHNKWSGKEEPYYNTGLYRNDTTIDGRKHYYGMQLNVHTHSDTILYRSICEGSFYDFNNQRLTQQGEYRDTLKNIAGCDSVVRLHLAVYPQIHNIVNRSIYEGDTVHFENKVYSEPGRYPFRYTSAAGCDSIIELNLTVKKLFDDSISVCYSDLPFEWRGKKIYESGIVRDTAYNSEGLPVVTGLKVTVLPTFRASEPLVKVICEGDYFSFNGQRLSEAGTYYDTLTAQNGCDSIISLALQVIPQNIQSNSKIIYEGDSVFFDGEWRKESGIYEYTEKGDYGCLNVYRLAVTVLKQFYVDTTAYVCSNELPFVWHGIEYHASGDYTIPTAWTDSSQVITTLHLTVNPTWNYERNITLCEGSTFIYKNKSYKQSGYFFDTIPSTVGCDSICKFIISVHPSYDRIDTVHISDKETYDFNGRQLNQSGYYESTGKTIYGCDSMAHLVLVVHPSYYNYDSINLCQGDTLYWHDQKIFKTGLYSDSLLTETYNFDSVYQVRVIVHEKYYKEQQFEIVEGHETYIHGINISKPGVYYDSLLTIHGCDSVYQIVVNWARKFTQHWDITICQGEYYDFFGTKLTHSGDYDHTSIKGDSTIYLHLTVNPTSISDERIVISPEDLPYIYKERTYDAGGVYTNVYQNRFKCDSICQLTLVVSQHVSEWDQMPLCPGQQIKIDGIVIDTAGLYTFVKRSKVSGLLDSLYRVEVFDAPDFEAPTDSIVICEGDTVIFGGRPVFRAGLHTANLKTIHGCDSILRLFMTVNPSYLYPTSATITDYQSYTWRGKEYTKQGIYDQSYPTIKDCDSTYRLNLTVIETKRYVDNDSICLHDTLRWRNHILTDPGIYSDTICNLASLTSVIYTLNLGVVTPTIIKSASVTETAADVESFNINFTYSGLRPNTYSVQFDERAHAEGFEDIINKPFGPNLAAEVPMPHKTKVVYQEHTEYVRPNYYTMRLALDNSVCGISRSDSLTLLIRYPSWIIEQNWDDVVAPLRSEYNGGYEFGSYIWYLNNEPFQNGGLPYLYSKELKPGDQVVLYATRLGENYNIPTAPLVITAPVPEVFTHPVLVYPNVVSKARARVNIQSESDGSYKVYSATGQLFSTGTFDSGEHSVAVPAVSGCCFIQATTEDGYTVTQKILVY